MLINELYAHYKTWTKLAKELDIGMNAHQYWRKVGYIPYTAQLLIEKKTDGFFKADKSHARPVEG
jgi:hypothetical protein